MSETDNSSEGVDRYSQGYFSINFDGNGFTLF